MSEAVEPKPVETPVTAQPDTAALQKELETLKASLAEKDEAVRFWYDKASGAKKPEAVATPEVPDDDTDLLDLISKSGSKGLKGWMAKQGFVSSAEVDQRVQERASQITREAQLVQQYPDLKDESSDFFKSVAKEFRQLKGKVSDELAMEMAAERVELAQLRAGKGKPDDKQQRQQEREERAKAQSGDRGKAAKRTEDEEDDELTPEQLQVCKQFGIAPEAYIKRAKAGVQFAGKK